jgi:hypothetical protein
VKRHIEKSGKKSAAGFVRFTVDRRGGESELQGPVVFARQFGSRSARLNSHLESH